MADGPVVAITFAGEDWDYGRSEALYLEAIRAAGGDPLPVRPGAEKGIPALLRRVDGVVLAGGDDMGPEYYGEEPHPALGLVNGPRDRLEFLLARAVLAQGVPALGICNGVQVLNVASGGTLYQDLPSQAEGAGAHSGGARHPVRAEGGGRLAALLGPGEVEVNSHHHQAVRRVGRGLAVAARSPDGVVEALEGTGPAWTVGVQWHPERPGCAPAAGGDLVRAFIAACSERIPSRGARPS